MKSQLLAELLANIDTSKRLAVLDAGSGSAPTVEYFSRFRCRLHFADLRDLSDAVFPPETRFDLVLFWDRLNRFDSASLVKLAASLRPHIHRETHAHVFAAGARAHEIHDRSYGVVDSEHVAVANASGACARRPHTQNAVTEAFDYLEVRRRTLLSSGLLELWLQGADHERAGTTVRQ